MHGANNTETSQVNRSVTAMLCALLILMHHNLYDHYNFHYGKPCLIAITSCCHLDTHVMTAVQQQICGLCYLRLLFQYVSQGQLPPQQYSTKEINRITKNNECEIWSDHKSLWKSPALWGRLHLKCDGTRAQARFRLSAKWTSSFKLVGASVQLTTGSRGVHIDSSNAGYTMFWGSVKSTGYSRHLPVSPSLPLPCVTMCHHSSTGLYHNTSVGNSGIPRNFVSGGGSCNLVQEISFHIVKFY